ncbi:MAG: putative metal-dependent hydrolase [Phormidesmis priestleyi Ana]|uniref:Putative metal-dependent hydrolase n=1 Tax=Phormidesmis priestleyi Ana TaxID=1666911 RepID=A0A0P7ZLZ9_9CYAN|nr:MAG: putative metal-dependent hydrolase [Phormidesmis priestleyi Ana]
MRHNSRQKSLEDDGFSVKLNLMSQLELFPNAASAASPSALLTYRVRESKRAKHVSIKVSVEGEVEVVIPSDFDRAKLPEILAKRQTWIANTRAKLLSTAEATPADWDIEKPQTILLRWRSTNLEADLTTAQPATPKNAGHSKGFATPKHSPKPDKTIETWAVVYQTSASHQTRCIPSLDGRLIIRGNTEPVSVCQSVLKKWLAHRAHKDLTPWLRQLGFELDLPCRRISIRGQKTRWASCSSQKDISLNYKLLFLPRPLVHYVLVHELCHTVHMNHSHQFWALVAEKLPDYKRWDSILKTGWRYVPRWVETK